MKNKKNVSLKNLNTFHIDAITKNLYIPENVDDLISLLKKLKGKDFYVLSGGSNVLLNDNEKYENIIYMSDIDKKIDYLGKGKFYIGSSNRIQKVINEINRQGYGGIELLYSIPAMLGGLIYMNAGIGGRNNSIVTISDFIDRVKVLNRNNFLIEWIEKDNCCFSHRRSIFQNDNYIILGAECNFKVQDLKKSKRIISDRINNFSKKEDFGSGTFGTVFSVANGKLLRIISCFKGRCGKIRFGKDNKNWLVNDGNGTYDEAMEIINTCKKIHNLFHADIECEVRIWK